MTDKLKKNLTLFDVYAMSTGAMFSSGLFLLPGIAASHTGDSVYLAYLVAGLLILPAMYCMAELSTAMPKAGGTYYFLDRAMGPLLGTIGGLGSWVAVVFKSSFALVGMGAYLSLYIDIPFTILAVILTVVFGVINVLGAKETTFLQRVLVSALVVILTAFIILGLQETGWTGVLHPNSANNDFFTFGFVGFVSTIGLVFVSYAGLTKVASVAEEIENPDRNIPLGMTLSLITATVIYTLGAMIIINILPSGEMHSSLTPVADAGRKFLDWVPYDIGVVLIVVAAIAAFASTGNAGIMSASRYPFAMAKDKLLPEKLAKLGRQGTPTMAIVLTVLTMIAVLVVFDVEAVAKLASAFQLLLFGLVSCAVIVMRESRIFSYRPGFKTPFYPWLPVSGLMISFLLIVEMGILAVLFTGFVVICCALWYQFYAAGKIDRRGAIFHVHQRLGSQKYEGLEMELMSIIHDRTQSENLSYEAIVARSAIVDLVDPKYKLEDFNKILLATAADRFSKSKDPKLPGAFEQDWIFRPVGDGVYLARKSIADLLKPQLIGLRIEPSSIINVVDIEDAHTLFFLIVPKRPVGLDLRVAGHLAEVVQSDEFTARWLSAQTEKELNSILMRDNHFYHGPVEGIALLRDNIGKPIGDIELPESCLIALIERDGEVIIATAKVRIQAGDEVAIIGEPDDIDQMIS